MVDPVSSGATSIQGQKLENLAILVDHDLHADVAKNATGVAGAHPGAFEKRVVDRLQHGP